MTPQPPDCESCLLSCLILGVDGWAVTEDLFTRPVTKFIYDAIVHLRNENQTVDTITLWERLQGKVDFVDLNEVINACPTDIHYSSHLRDARLALAKRKRQFLSEYVKHDKCSHDDMRRLFKEIVTLEETAAIESPKKLERLRFDPTRTPPEIRPVYAIGKKVIGSAGNIEVIAAKPKAGKSAFTSAMISASTGLPGDTLFVRSANPHGHAVILLDTEQSEADFYRVCRTSFKRVNAEPPSWFWGYSVLPMSLADRREALRTLLAMARRNLGGVHSVFLDGVADFVTDPNDSEDCLSYVAELHRMATQYDTCIYCVLHFNPGESYKMRGHLGSQLERQVEVSLAMDKNADGITSVYTAASRRAPIFKSDMVKFRWSDLTGMHMSHQNAQTPDKEESPY